MKGARRVAISVIAIVFAVALLGACGSDNDAGASIPDTADGRAVQDLIMRHYASPSCDDLTDAGRTAFGHPVADGACAKDIATQKPEDVTVNEVTVDGESGTAATDNFNFDVTKVNGDWKIDGGS